MQGREEIRGGITQLSDHVAARLRLCGMKCQGVSLAIRDPDFHDISRQTRLDTPTYLGRELARSAMALADQCWSMDRPVRALTVTAIYLIPAEEAAAQLELWDAPRQHQRERRERLEQTMDAIRAKYGGRAIQPASAPRGTASTGHDPFPDREGT